MKRKLLFAVFILCFSASMFAQKTITGTVKDATSEPLTGVSVSVKGTKRGTVTDIDGNFTLQVLPNDKSLSFSYIGMKDKTVTIGNETQYHVTLEENSQLLNEVVVTSLNLSRDKKSLTAAQQRVNAETVAEVRDQNIVASLAGKVAGVQVTPPASSTGSARIVIRGNSSFTGNNQPLFVVDGMQIDNFDGSASVNKNGGLDMGNGAADINADDIESIDVLKGPNAAALYGSRAANGVILITTKKAKDGRFKVSFNSNTMFRYVSQWPDFQNAFGVGHMTQMLGGNRQSNVLLTADENGNPYPYPGLPSMQGILNSIASRSNGAPMVGQPYLGLDGQMHTYSPEPDNVYGFYQKASTYNNNVAIEGGNVDNNYRVSLTNFSADDMVENYNKVNKNTINMRFFNTLVKNLTLDSKVTLVDEDTKNRRYSNQSGFNPLFMYTIMPRTMTLDQLKHYKTDAGQETARVGDIHNPYWIINETHNEDIRTRLLANFDLSYQILPSLRTTVKYAREYIQTKANEFRNKGALGGDDNNGMGYYKQQSNLTDNNMYEWLLLYNQRFSDIFSVVGTLGGSQQNWKDSWFNQELVSLKQAGFADITNSNDPPRASAGGPNRHRINALYGSLSLGYRDFVYLDVTGRNDWSSTLPKGNNSYFYPSVGLSFIPTAMLNIPDRIFYGKVRGSWAQVGNDTGPYRLLPYFNMGQDNIFAGYKYASIDGTLPNSQLKPERTKSWELGADLRFFNGRITADVTYYKKNSFDQIMEAEMAASSGYSRKVFNAGEIENKGWEVAAHFVPVETKLFSWNMEVNYTKNNSMVKSMVEGADMIEIGEVFSARNRVVVGYPYGAMFGTVWLKDQQGRRMVNLTNGEPVRLENQYIGNATPDFLLSVGNRFKYRDFDLYVLADMKWGGDLYSGTRRQSIRNGVISGLEEAQEGYWKRTTIFGDTGDYTWGGVQFNEQGKTTFNNQLIYYYRPEMYDNINNMNPVDPNYAPEVCDRYFWPGNVGYYADGYDDLVIYDASFIKLREVSLGYNLPKKTISKIKMSNVRLSIVGRNLWIFHQKTPKGLDPEAAMNAGNGQGMESGSLPPSTTLGFDIKIAF